LRLRNFNEPFGSSLNSPRPLSKAGLFGTVGDGWNV